MKTQGTVRGALRLLSCAAALAAAAPLAAHAKSILVIGPHEDDETLLGGGRTRAAVLAGDTVHVVLVTNGDINGTAEGLARQAESVAAAAVLGVPEQNVVFLGYGDQLLFTLWSATSGTQVYRSAAGQTATYGNRGLGGMDFHRFRTGTSGAYSRDTIVWDFQELIRYFQPDEVYTVSYWDNHGDHSATARLVNEALVALKRQGQDLRVKAFESIVWAPYANGGCYGDWPPPGSGALPYPPFTAPQCVGRGVPLDWQMIRRFPQPADMQAPDPASNLKWRALEAYPTQFNDFLTSFVRKDEFFWVRDFATHVSSTAAVTVSSDYPAAEGAKEHAVDGYVEYEREWKAQQDSGVWIQLDWPSPQRVGQVVLSDRLDPNDNVLAGTLSFSDGSTVAVGALPTGGLPAVYAFPPRTVGWVRFAIDRWQGSTPGLAEIEVLGVPATRADNVPPHVIRGPLPSTAAVDVTQTVALSVEAHDLDGDALTYAWSADAGSVSGSGSTAVFTPPTVAANTVVTVTVRVEDGNGGAATNSAFVTVTAASANAVSLAPTSVPSGAVSRGTVTLSAAAPSGGVSVPLASGNPTVASVPASVTVAAGRTSATFDVATYTVAAPTPVTISASFGGQVRTAQLTVTPPVPSSLAISPASAVGGSTVAGTVSLTAAAPAGGTQVSLASSDPSLASVPATVTVPPGQASAGFAVATGTVTAPQTLVLSAASGGTTVTASLTLSPLGLAAAAVSPAAVAGGQPSTGTVTLNGPAPAGGALVLLSSSNPAVASVPASATVAEGATSATFGVATVPVAASSPVTITAAYAGTTRAATLTVNPVSLSAVSLAPTSVVGGGTSTGTVTLTGPAPAGGLSVPLSASNATVVSVPGSVAIPEGATSATFPVATSPVAASTSVTISATRAGVTRTATLTVTALTVSSLKLSPTSVVGGSSSTGTVTLSAAAPATGAVVTLTSGNVAAATVPATVTVPGGATTATFPVSTSAVATQTTSSISARYGNTRSATLTVRPPALSTLALSPTSVVGGTGSSGTVTLTGPAPAGGLAVGLASSIAASATVPATVVVPEGSRTAAFPVTTFPVTALSSPRITATLGTVSRSATLTVTARPASLSLALAPASVPSGGTSTGTVTLNAPAPAGGSAVTLRSSNTAVATVPASVTVPEGSATATFAVQARTVTATSTSSISAVAGGVTKSATLTVTP